MLPWQARAQRAPRQARAGSSSRLYWKDADIIDNTFHMMAFHATMTGARPARTSSGARQARAGSSSRLYWKDAG